MTLDLRSADLTEYQTGKLLLLYRLMILRCAHIEELNDQGVLLLDRAIASLVYDCQRAGVDTEAHRIISGVYHA